MNRLIGFSTGVLFQSVKDTVSREMLEICQDIGCNAVEINCHLFPGDTERLKDMSFNWQIFNDVFDHASVHLPSSVSYEADNSYVLFHIQHAVTQFLACSGMSYILVHPDCVPDFNIFDTWLPQVAIENMDHRKQSYTTAVELQDLLAEHRELKFVFDVQHWAVNNNSIEDIPYIIDELSDKLVGVHLSGEGSDKYHVPVCRTKQRNLVESLQNLPAHIPIILEGVCEDVAEMKHELDYVTNILT